MIKNKYKVLLLLALISVMIMCLYYGTITLTYAAFTNRTIIEDSFDNGLLDINYWKNTDSQNTNVIAEEGAIKGLVCDDIGGATGLVSANYITSGATIDVEFIKFIAPESGWLAFNFGTQTTGTDFVEYSKLDKGKVLMLRFISNQWALQSFSEIQQDFVGADGKSLRVDTTSRTKEYPYTTVYFLGNNLPCDNGVLTNTTITVSYDVNGFFEIYYRNKDESFENKILVAKSTVALSEYYPGRVGIQFAKGETARKSELIISSLNVYKHTEDGMEVVSALQDGKNALSQFYTYQSPNYSKLFYGQYGNLSFNKNSNDTAMVVLMTQIAEITKKYDDKVVFNASSTLRIKEIKGEKKFIVGFGLSNYRKNNYEEKSVTNIYFKRSGSDIVYGVTGFDDSLNETVILSEQKLPEGINYNEFTFEIKVKGNKQTTLYFNGIEGKSFNVNNYAGNYFYSLGGANTDDDNYVNVLIDNVVVKNANYSTPGFGDISADFTNNEFNNNVWRVSNDMATLELYAGNVRQRSTGVYVENEELLFDNVNQNSNITTIPEYANFELEFDLTDVLREPITENGKIVKPASAWIGVMFGVPGANYKDYFTTLVGTYKCPLICFSTITNGIGGAINGYFTENTKGVVQITNLTPTPLSIVLSDEYNMFSKDNEGKIFKIKITLIDGLLSISLKRNDLEWYSIKFNDGNEFFDCESSPIGCVSIRGYGDGTLYNSSTFTIDNISIKNKDDNGDKELIGFDFRTNKLPLSKEINYTPVLSEEQLLPIEPTKATSSGCGSEISASNIVSVALLSLSVFIIITKRKKQKNI